MKKINVFMLGLIIFCTSPVKAYNLQEFNDAISAFGEQALKISPVAIGVLDGVFDLKNGLCVLHVFSKIGVTLAYFNSLSPLEKRAMKVMAEDLFCIGTPDDAIEVAKLCVDYVVLPPLKYSLGVAIGKKLRIAQSQFKNYFFQ